MVSKLLRSRQTSPSIPLVCGEQESRLCITIFCPVMLSNCAMTASTASANTSSTTEPSKCQTTWSSCIKQILRFCWRSGLCQLSDSGNTRCAKKASTRLSLSSVSPSISRESLGDEPNGSNLMLHSWCWISIRQRRLWKSAIIMVVITANWVSSTEKTALSLSNQLWLISRRKTALQICRKFAQRSSRQSKKLSYHLTSIIFSARFHTRRNRPSRESVLTPTPLSNLAPTGWWTPDSSCWEAEMRFWDTNIPKEV